MKKNGLKITILILLFLAGFSIESFADKLYLKNGRSIEGLIKSEDGDSIELEVSGGLVKFTKSEIERIERASSEESIALRQKWERQKKETREKISRRKAEEERKPKQIEFSQGSQGIVVKATLNKKVEATLVLDTGASLVTLRKNVAEKLGINLERVKPDAELILADGRRANAKHIVLENLKVENVEAENVEATILLDDVGDPNFYDGLLGMSFLKRFNFKIDQKEKKLILEKLE